MRSPEDVEIHLVVGMFENHTDGPIIAEWHGPDGRRYSARGRSPELARDALRAAVRREHGRRF